MGNVPAKEGRARSSSYSAGGAGGNLEVFSGRGGRRGTSLSIFGGSIGDQKKSKRLEERERQREIHYSNLIVRFEENVDGGYLAPYGTYKSNLDFDTNVVRRLIISRQVAPFYTPLQDYDDEWTDEELVTILSQLPLHTIETAYSDLEEDDPDDYKIRKSQSYYRRQEQKARVQLLAERTKDAQKEEENRFMEEKIKVKEGYTKASQAIPSKDLLLDLYKNAVDCPICFLYYPQSLNISRCCNQPICTECFVQIKRLDPHPPHDDSSNLPGSDTLPHSLISEPANCPYCALVYFGVTYERPKHIEVGINGVKPAQYVSKLRTASTPANSTENTSATAAEGDSKDYAVGPRRASCAANAPGVITTDMIRPDWELKLNSARSKLARRAAAASAIHASNFLLNEDDSQTSVSRRFSAGDAEHRQGSSSSAKLRSFEDRMIDEALRLSIIDEEERKKRAELEERKSNSKKSLSLTQSPSKST